LIELYKGDQGAAVCHRENIALDISRFIKNNSKTGQHSSMTIRSTQAKKNVNELDPNLGKFERLQDECEMKALNAKRK